MVALLRDMNIMVTMMRVTMVEMKGVMCVCITHQCKYKIFL